jgi:hypothetical protein
MTRERPSTTCDRWTDVAAHSAARDLLLRRHVRVWPMLWADTAQPTGDHPERLARRHAPGDFSRSAPHALLDLAMSIETHVAFTA